ncbi:MAG: hypothetical protein A3F54_03390 [Candidatus Kerfeldbacteria bacterium RIFCSPHIGHO2_12_FULL_48_17]|uniref:Uncharacterized protein n=1 Tax=Candidatus Kerfeldbacteria bacterium RIFCSPHIGHO2_12_FULL_48_17 TaxID=1798542 RepID=A0A1G2B696_9BACT|nr:MAG: hypothetical protein A3F54_03390 [Candidatus Kerfeldbacteria bacterium RIFCSPHIGHO2_12_FULL_48_17]
MLSCKQCAQTFTIAPQDQKILDTFDAPAPKLCRECNLKQRLAFRNERNLFRRTCEKCHKSILALYSKASTAHVYCRECWYNDTWDTTQYGRDYDPARPFFDQMKELTRAVPVFNLWQIGQNENCDYTNAAMNCKDCYFLFSALEDVGCVYCEQMGYSKDCSNCLHVDYGELMYDCVTVNTGYKCAGLLDSDKCTECYLGRDLTDCQNCFGCVNLKHKQYYWYNEPLEKTEYERRLAEALATRESWAAHQQKFTQHAAKYPRRFARKKNTEGTGYELTNSSDIRQCIIVWESQNCGESMDVFNSKDVYRCNHMGWLENTYQVATSVNVTYSLGVFGSEYAAFLNYCYLCFNSENLFGCSGLRKKKFCILNKQYSEEAYKKLRAKIISDMKARGEWGQFFPTQLSLLPYNETMAQRYFPLTKEEARKQGFMWNDETAGLRNKETLPPDKVPNKIPATPDTITKEILRCTSCDNNYRILTQELKILRALHIAVPLECQDCSHKNRLKHYLNPFLRQHQCDCTKRHPQHAATDRCPNTFETIWSHQPEPIFCKTCFEAELGD